MYARTAERANGSALPSHPAIPPADDALDDECKDWADKAEALASYAKQAEDDTLRKMADRSQARAVSRAGELVRTFNAQGARTDLLSAGDHQKLTQSEAASRAGMSEHQMKTAVRVSKVPEEVRQFHQGGKGGDALEVRLSHPACRCRRHPNPEAPP